MPVLKRLFGIFILPVLCAAVFVMPAFGANCSSSQCYNGNFCEDKPTTNGFYVVENGKCSVYRYDNCVCNDGDGWNCKWIALSTGAPINYCDGKSECVVGMRQYQATGCNTQVRSCCNNNAWSDWSGKCNSSCSGDTCWNGSSCASKPQDATYTKCDKCQYLVNYTCNSGSGWKETSRTYTNTCSTTHCVYNGACRALAELGGNYSINSTGHCVICNTFKRKTTLQGSTTFDSYSKAVSAAKSKDTCNGSESSYSASCTKASTCQDVVISTTPNYTGRWYETGDIISKTKKNSSDSTTCSLYGSYNTKMDANQACSRKYSGSYYTSDYERSSTCYNNCVEINSGYDVKYKCSVNILYCKPVFYVYIYNSECLADCK